MTLEPDPGDLSGDYVCLLPGRDVPAGYDPQTRREAALLDALPRRASPRASPRGWPSCR